MLKIPLVRGVPIFIIVASLSTWLEPPPAAAAAVVNEVLRQNDTLAEARYLDDAGEKQGWVELFNPGTSSVSLAGWRLVDAGDPSRSWSFPGISLAPKAFLRVWGSGKDRRDPARPLHTSFPLVGSSGILLLEPDGATVADRVSGVALPTDVSFGRAPDGGSERRYFRLPTPGSSNTTSGSQPFVIDRDHVSLTVGSPLRLGVTPAGEVSWTSDNPFVHVGSDGTVQAIQDALSPSCAATITASSLAGAGQDTCDVTIVNWTANVSALRIVDFPSVTHVLGAEGDTVYFVNSKTLYGTRDDFRTSTALGTFPASLTSPVMLMTPFGYFVRSAQYIYRSNDLAHWSTTLTLATEAQRHGNAWDLDPASGTGYVYAGEYSTDPALPHRVFRGTFVPGKSATWQVVLTFDPKSGWDSDHRVLTAVRHIHVVAVDPYTGHVWVGTGDTNVHCRMLYSKDRGATFTVVGMGSQAWRTLSIWFTERYVYWNTDSTAPQSIWRIPRSKLEAEGRWPSMTPELSSGSTKVGVRYYVTRELVSSRFPISTGDIYTETTSRKLDADNRARALDDPAFDYREEVAQLFNGAHRNHAWVTDQNGEPLVIMSGAPEGLLRDNRGRAFGIKEFPDGRCSVQELLSFSSATPDVYYTTLRMDPVAQDSRGFIYFVGTKTCHRICKARLAWVEAPDAPGPGGAFIVGDPAVHPEVSTSGSRRAMPCVVSRDGSIETVSIYHEAGGGRLLMGVYADAGGGKPGSLLGRTGVAPVTNAAGWQTVALESPAPVAAGAKIWLAWVFEDNPGIRYADGTPRRAQSSEGWAAGMPQNFGTASLDDYRYSICATVVVRVDLPPAARLIAPDVTAAGATVHTLSITYTDDRAVDVGDLDGNDIIVTGPEGFEVAAACTGVDATTDGTPRIATYAFAPPGGSWNWQDNGTYTVWMARDQVSDTGDPPKYVPEGPLGTFRVAVRDYPTLVGAVLTDDTGPSAADRVTADDTPSFLLTFSEPVLGTDEAIALLDPFKSSAAGFQIAGWGSSEIALTPGFPLDEEGSYTIVLRGAGAIVDDEGNPLNGGAGEEIPFVLDRTPPAVAADALVTADATPRLTGTTDDPTAAVAVTVAGATYAATNRGDGTWVLPDNVIAPALSPGIYVVEVGAIDLAGNSAVDTTSSELTIEEVQTVGITSILGNVSTKVRRRAMPFVAPRDGMIESLTIYHGDGSGRFLMGIYADDGSEKPGARLGLTAVTAVSAAEGWQTVPLIEPVAVEAGSSIWFAWVFENDVATRYDAGSPGRAQSGDGWSDRLPAAFGSSTIEEYRYSIYGTYASGEIRTIGITSILGNESTKTRRRAMPFAAPRDGMIDSLTMYHGPGSGRFLLGVYADDGSGKPGARLGLTAVTAVSAAEGWQTVPLIEPVAVQAGSSIWFAWVFENDVATRYDTGTPGRAQSGDGWSALLPATFGSSTIEAYRYSIYGTYRSGQ